VTRPDERNTNVTQEDKTMSERTPVDVSFVPCGGGYRAVPPSHVARPFAKRTVTFRNFTRSEVDVFFPRGFLAGGKSTISAGGEETYTIADVPGGSYPYAAYVVDAKQFVEGNSSPEIIIDT
jgi:hypothetical protein